MLEQIQQTSILIFAVSAFVIWWFESDRTTAAFRSVVAVGWLLGLIVAVVTTLIRIWS